jgi:hypothetical protein
VFSRKNVSTKNTKEPEIQFAALEELSEGADLETLLNRKNGEVSS